MAQTNWRFLGARGVHLSRKPKAADNRAYNLRSRRVGLAFVKQFVATLLALLVMSPGLCDGNKPTSPVLGTPRGSIRSNLTSLSA